MTRSSSAGTDSVGRFLRNQRFRHQETRRVYGHILRAISCVRVDATIKCHPSCNDILSPPLKLWK
jgi:hypothetical protein